jgi:hypothetical protein
VPKRVDRGVGFCQGAFCTSAHLVRSLQFNLQVSDLALQGLAPLLVPNQGGVGFGAEVRTACLEVLGVPSLELLLQADPSLVQHAVHPLLEGGLAQVQRLLVPGQVRVGLVDHLLPALEGLPLPVESVFKGVELLLSEAQLLLAVTSLCFLHGEPSLLQAQALHVGNGALLAGVEKGFAVLGFLQPLLGVGQEAIGVGPGLV